MTKKSEATRIPQAETAADIQAARRAMEKAKATHGETANALRKAREQSDMLAKALADVAISAGSHEEMVAAYDVAVAEYNAAQAHLQKCERLHAGTTRVANDAAAAVTRLVHADQIVRVEKLFRALQSDMGQLADMLAIAEPLRLKCIQTIDKIRAAWPGGNAPVSFAAKRINHMVAEELYRLTHLDVAPFGREAMLPWPAPERPVRTGEYSAVPLALRHPPLKDVVADYVKWASDLMHGRRRYDGRSVEVCGPDSPVPATPPVSTDLPEPERDDTPPLTEAEIFEKAKTAGTLKTAEQITAEHQAAAEKRWSTQ